MTPVFCKTGQRPCGYCSEEIYRNYTRASDIHSHKVIRLVKEYPLGQMCNNACCWAGDLKECPVPAAVEVCKKAIAEYDPDNPLLWMKRKAGAVI